VTAALKTVAAWLGAMVLATVGLLFVNWLLRKLLDDNSFDLWLGLIFALVVYAVLFKAFSLWPFRQSHGWPAAALTSFGFIVCLPAFLVWVDDSDGPEIRAQAPIHGRIDLAIVASGPLKGIGSRPPAPPGDLAAWDVRYTVAVASEQGNGLEVLVAGTESRGTALRALRTGRPLESPPGAVEWRPDVQRAAVLAASGSPAASGLADHAERLDAPAFALLADAEHRDEWVAWAERWGGDASTYAELEGPTPVDSALRLIAQSRTALADRQLAYAYRPLLFFDKREVFDWPVDVDAAFAEGAVTMCKHDRADERCEQVRRGADLDQSFDYVKFDAKRFTAADLERRSRVAGSTYYYRVVKRRDGSSAIDYWWYLPYNPSLSVWMCSPGLGLPEFSCFDHESDWEGITVEVGPDGGRPRAVYYAQHANVARHEWADLLDGWAGLDQGVLVEGDGAHHPLVFVAHSSHAAYRNPCQALFCVQYGSVLPEGRFGGRGVWPSNDDELCASRCLKPLPLTRQGEPATWNAFSGPWGTQHCILGGTFCDRGEAPHSPAFQWRYEHPAKER
jgi:hypothetical protein